MCYYVLVLLLPIRWRLVPCMWQVLPIPTPRRFQIRAAFQQGLGRSCPHSPDSIKQPQGGSIQGHYQLECHNELQPSCLAQNWFEPFSSFIYQVPYFSGLGLWPLSSNLHSLANYSPPIQQICVHCPPTEKKMRKQFYSIGSPAAQFPHLRPPHWGPRPCSSGIGLFLNALGVPHRIGPFDSSPALRRHDDGTHGIASPHKVQHQQYQPIVLPTLGPYRPNLKCLTVGLVVERVETTLPTSVLKKWRFLMKKSHVWEGQPAITLW